MSIRRFVYSDNKRVSKVKADTYNNYFWVAFEQNSDGSVILEKQSAFDPTQIFFSLEREAESILGMALNATQLFVSYAGHTDDLLGERISVINPLTSTDEIVKPVGVTEDAVDVQMFDDEFYFLTPGVLSGSNAKLIHYEDGGDFIEVIDLTKTGLTITDAKSMAIDNNGDIWIVTYTSPATIVRVFQLSGGAWDFEETEIS